MYFILLTTLFLAVMSAHRAEASMADEFVAAHNKYRKKEGAGNMDEMEWSDAIAANAQAHANKCQFAHTSASYRQDIDGFDYLGENLWMKIGDRSYEPDAVVKAWYDEKIDYNLESLSCSAVCGHYTQVVWAKSRKVGCGVGMCPQEEEEKVIVVCQYGPGGNYVGEPPYEVGTPCSRCPDGYVCHNALCAKAKKRSILNSPLFRIRALNSKRSGVL